MKKLITLLAVALCAGLLTGCAGRISVPANTVTFETPSGKLKLSHPQNTKMKMVDISIETNGTVHAKIDSLETVNDAEVIDKSAAGQAAIITAQGNALEKAFKAGGELAGAAVGTAAKTAAK